MGKVVMVNNAFERTVNHRSYGHGYRSAAERGR